MSFRGASLHFQATRGLTEYFGTARSSADGTALELLPEGTMKTGGSSVGRVEAERANKSADQLSSLLSSSPAEVKSKFDSLTKA